jgi:tRNA threonylcarbamoyladenosine biosynthesis protein TsaE
MGESELIQDFRTEAELIDSAGVFARRLRTAPCGALLIGVRGDLGAGKTTWVRGMLRGLGYAQRVPSPTYTLLEHYALEGLAVVHLDLYRLRAEEELENLGLRDWLARPDTWVLVEWPERAPRLEQSCDLSIVLAELGTVGRRIRLTARTATGNEALRAARDSSSK